MGIYLKKELKNGAVIAVWDISESEKELLEIISKDEEDREEELEEISLYKSEQHRREKLAVIALVQSLFEEPVHIGHHENGSPYIENDSTHISITHTDKFAAVIIHPTEDVGIDVESVKRDFTAVEKRALNDEERDDLIEKDDDPEKMEERNTQLAIYWCAKEALYKRMGRHNVDFSEDMEVEHFNVREEGEIDVVFKYPKSEHIVDEDGEEQNEEEEFTMQYEVFENHVLVWMVG
ncbi:MAG: 4'-phosphopantetheinyl transferase superfamily protein [Bacteroidales bacterium]|nr:4'-phosphopantetheinyl transferase superfamily protein [Bacteroidales bacterium]MBR5908113.1 4'-phosphopantetheinyl transferase superfamily protein [Bacteroidales bacterium]